jgi:hypothetical protein
MEQQIIDFIKNKSNVYVDIDNEESIEKIYKLLINNIIYEPTNAIENHYLGWYYAKIKQDYDQMKKYYMIGIDNGNTHSINNLGGHYQKIEINYDLMKKYYLMGIDCGNSTSMHDLAYYYHTIEANYDLMKKYYLMSIDKGSNVSMNNLGHYYQNIEKNYDEMEKYYLMAIDNDNNDSIINLVNYYNNNNLLILKLEFYIKYIDKIERIKIIETINEIGKIDLSKEDIKKFVDIIINFKFKKKDKVLPLISILVETIKYKLTKAKLHFEYSMEGKGFKEAEKDFYDKII